MEELDIVSRVSSLGETSFMNTKHVCLFVCVLCLDIRLFDRCQPTFIPLVGNVYASWGGENSIWAFAGQPKCKLQLFCYSFLQSH